MAFQISNLLTDSRRSEAAKGILHRQRDKGERFYMGGTLSAVDIYSATFMAYFKPLAAEHSPMPDSIRSAFESMSEQINKALDPILIEHRDVIYSEYLELPLI